MEYNTSRRLSLALRTIWANDTYRELREAEPHGQFDFVIMWNVIEHLRQPWITLDEIRHVVKPQGWVIISTPSASSLKARLQRSHWDNYWNPTHFYYFTRQSPLLVLQRFGFSNVSEWHRYFDYPHHGILRRILQRLCMLRTWTANCYSPFRLPGRSGVTMPFVDSSRIPLVRGC